MIPDAFLLFFVCFLCREDGVVRSVTLVLHCLTLRVVSKAVGVFVRLFSFSFFWLGRGRDLLVGGGLSFDYLID